MMNVKGSLPPNGVVFGSPLRGLNQSFVFLLAPFSNLVSETILSPSINNLPLQGITRLEFCVYDTKYNSPNIMIKVSRRF